MSEWYEDDGVFFSETGAAYSSKEALERGERRKSERDKSRKRVKRQMRSQLGLQPETGVESNALYTALQERLDGRRFADIVVEGLGHKVAELSNFYEGFEEQLKRYHSRDRTWPIDKKRIAGVLDVINDVIQNEAFDVEDSPQRTVASSEKRILDAKEATTKENTSSD